MPFFKFDRHTQGSFGGQFRNTNPVYTKASAGSFGSNYNLNRFNTNTDDLTRDSVIEEWLPKTPQLMNKLYRTIHQYDSVAGPAVDLISIMPFSDVTLIGVDDPKILRIYEQSIEELHLTTLLPEIASEYLIIGRVIGSLLFDKTKGIWTDIIIQDPDYCEVTNIPLRGFDPKVDLRVSNEFREFLLSKDPRDAAARKDIPEELLQVLLKKDIIPLDPISTLYLPRQTYPANYLGSSIYCRILPFWALEKTLFNGTLIGAKRRQRSILHATVGETDIWEPDEEDISTIAGMFMQADEDPQGAIVATRHGVEVNEVRSGSDFWKISDEWDFLSTSKMRALGINESFLCLAGDTLITTEYGLQRIDQMKNSDEVPVQSISTKVLSKNNKEGTAIKWIYRGEAEVQETLTDNGRLFKTTKEHKVLVLDRGTGVLQWKEVVNLEVGDSLCISTQPYIRKTQLKLNLPALKPKKHATCTKELKIPQYMTPELAYLLGLLVSEGCFNSNRISFSNSRVELLDEYIRLMLDLFNLKVFKTLISKKGDVCTIKGISSVCKVDTYSISTDSIVLTSWLDYLGLHRGFVNGKYPSYFKTVPWSILQADGEAQLAYLAAYLEGDGTIPIDGKGISFISVSRTNLRMMQTLLTSHGILGRVLANYPVLSLDTKSSLNLYGKLAKYLVSKQAVIEVEKKHVNGTYGGRKFGLPLEGLRIFLRTRKQQGTGLGTWFLNDNGETIFIEKWGVLDKSERWQRLLYDSYRRGAYTGFLEALKKISIIMHANIINLLELEYFYDSVVKLQEGRKQSVYDLTMSVKDKPAFIANGAVVHNSGDATYNCLVGKKTIVYTDRGLLYLDEIMKDEKVEGDVEGPNAGKAIDVDLTVASRYKAEKAAKWMYSGYTDTVRTVTKSGHETESTYEHPFLVFNEDNYEVNWKLAADVQKGDLLCLATKKSVTRKDRLELNLSESHFSRKEIKKPKYMTPELAYILGCLISEGTLTDSSFCFYNSDQAFIDKYTKCVKEVFNLDYSARHNGPPAGAEVTIKGNLATINTDSYAIISHSTRVRKWFDELGLYTGGNKNGKSASYYKVIPWCILQADEESQFAFLAAYLEGDGSIGRYISYFSRSEKLLKQLQAILGSQGIFAYKAKYALVLSGVDSFNLWPKIKAYMVTKALSSAGYKARNKFGFSNKYLKDFIAGRRIGITSYYINDQGEKIQLQHWGNSYDKRFLYDKYDRGEYNRFLENLKEISTVEYQKLSELFNCRYRFSPVVLKEDCGKQHVYDISMEKGIEPAFIANGLVVHNCQIGESLIPTEKGLLRIDEIAEGKEGEIKDIDLTVGSRYGGEKAVKWLNNGVADTLKVTDRMGYSLCCTPKHGLLVLRENELVWIETKELIVGDIVCISTKPLVRSTPLKLNLNNLVSLGRRPRKDIRKPEYMTPELAFILSCLVSEGSITKTDVKIYNSNEDLIKRYSECVEKVFGLKTLQRINTPKGARREVRGKEIFATKNCYEVFVCSRTLVDWLCVLGLGGKGTIARDKVVPWCILQADEQCQLAFLAAYIECDDGVDSKRGTICFHSVSKMIRSQIQALLNTHGIISYNDNKITVAVHPIAAYPLWKKIESYMVTKHIDYIPKATAIQKGYGIPTKYLKEFLKGRKVKSSQKGIIFLNDTGEEVVFKNISRWFNIPNRLLYDRHKKEGYSIFLNAFKQISELEYAKLIKLFETGFYFSELVSIVDSGKQPVYDLSMKKGAEPAYNSQCFQTHNTMEIALSVFVESLRNFRDNLVSRIFYEKLFPTLAKIHGFKRRSQAELAHGIRIGGKTIDSDLIMPQISFHKQLRPEADSSYLEVLGTMEEKGIPIPLRTWAAAGGLNLDTVFEMKDEDIVNRKYTKEWKEELKNNGGDDNNEEEGAWGAVHADLKTIKNTLDVLPIWLGGKFLGIKKEVFATILKSKNPKSRLTAKFKNEPKKIEIASYVLKRMGVQNVPFDLSVTRDIAFHLKQCIGVFSRRRVTNEFIALNKMIKACSSEKEHRPAKQLPKFETDTNLYSGVKK